MTYCQSKECKSGKYRNYLINLSALSSAAKISLSDHIITLLILLLNTNIYSYTSINPLTKSAVKLIHIQIEMLNLDIFPEIIVFFVFKNSKQMKNAFKKLNKGLLFLVFETIST